MGLLLLAVFCVAQADSHPLPIVTVTDWEFQQGNFYEAPRVSEETGSTIEALNHNSPVDTLESFVPPPAEIQKESKVEPVALADSIELTSHPMSTEPLLESSGSNSFMNFGVGESGEFRQPRSHQKGTSSGIASPSAKNTGGLASTNTAANKTSAPGATSDGVAVKDSVSRTATPTTIGIGTYPKRAIRELREGLVKLRVEVLQSGFVGQVELYVSSGHSDLDETALKAAKHWVFRPAHSGGSPVTTWLIVPVRYRLKDAP
jgi:protein TonB